MSLVLSRRVGEEIVIGKDITIRVAEIRRNKVKIMIDAPKEVGVDRNEVFRRKEMKKK